jgi:hypothetical protein
MYLLHIKIILNTNSNKLPIRCNNFPVYYPDFFFTAQHVSGVRLLLQSLSSWWWAGERTKHVKLWKNVRILNWKIVASGWWFIWIVRWCTDLQILNQILSSTNQLGVNAWRIFVTLYKLITQQCLTVTNKLTGLDVIWLKKQHWDMF